MTVRVLPLDDHQFVHQGARDLARPTDDLTVVGEATKFDNWRAHSLPLLQMPA
jgi:hypothetical protein